jgi:hypothetical protein|tara:strand:+ start:1517 stop:1678 length:162 start_codon:yes stop_codon:yes gene_type:complete
MNLLREKTLSGTKKSAQLGCEYRLDKIHIRELVTDIRCWVKSFVNRDAQNDEE